MKKYTEYPKWLLVGGGGLAVIIVLFVVYALTRAEAGEVRVDAQWAEPEEVGTLEEKEEDERGDDSVIVDVKGAVVTPGVYEVEEGSRVHEVLEKTGGLTDEADEDAVNLALRVHDEMVVYVPIKGETTDVGTSMQMAGDERLNINTATAEELTTLQGIGPARAEAIIAYREEHGSFEAVEALTNVSGIGPKSLEVLGDEIKIH